MSGEREFDSKKFEAALEEVLDGEKHDYPAYIGGLKVASGTQFPLVSPIDDTIIFGTLQEPEKGTASRAAEVAFNAFSSWSEEDPKKRSKILSDVADAAEKRKYFLAADVLLSTGMPRKEAVAEAETMISVVRKASKDALAISGKPRGVWAVISLVSSPLASPIGYAAAAIAAGNTVVIMPSGSCPRPVYSMYRLFEEAGLPDGVINIVTDRADRLVTELSDDLNVVGVVASGCGKAMEDLMFLAVDDELGYVNEAKGVNPIVVAHPADMKKAADDIIASAFCYCGQHLYSSSKVIVLADDESDLMKALIERMKDLNVTDPVEDGAFCGPLMNGDSEKRFKDLLDSEAAFLVHGGKQVRKEYTQNGKYYTPALLTGMDAEDDTLYIDNALPVLSIRSVGSVDEAMDDLAETDCGLSIGVMSSDASTINKVKSAAEECEVFVNCSSLSMEPARKAEAKNFAQ